MKIKLAQTKLDSKQETVTLKEIEDILETSKNNFIYLDKSNDSKILKGITKHFTKKSYFVYSNVVTYGSIKEEYIYELHIFK